MDPLDRRGEEPALSVPGGRSIAQGDRCGPEQDGQAGPVCDHAVPAHGQLHVLPQCLIAGPTWMTLSAPA